MLTLVRIVLGLIGLLAGWLFSYAIYFVGFDLAGQPFLGRGAPFLVGLVVAALILAATENLRHGFITATVLGAVLLGIIGFVLGFLVPVFIDPEASQGQLLGLLLTGPGGFLLGGPLGALWWLLQRRRLLA
jgi:hypothetical protein